MKQLLLTFVYIALIATGIHGAIDQSNTALPTLTDQTEILQSFTAGVDDDLVGIWIYIRSRYNGIDDYTVTLYSYANNCIDAALTQATFNESEVSETAGWFYIQFDSPVPIQSGIMYAFLIDSDGTSGISGGWIDFGIFTENYDIYSGGEALSYNGTSCTPLNNGNDDFSFQTVVGENDTAPEPIYTPSLLEISVQNRFDRLVYEIPFTVHEINSGRTFSTSSSREPFVILTRPGEQWTGNVDEGAFGNTGYNGSLAFSATINSSAPRSEVIRISNSSPRKLTDVNISTRFDSRGKFPCAYLSGAYVYPIQAETKYEIQYSKNLKTWPTADTFYGDKDRISTYPQWHGVYEKYSLYTYTWGAEKSIFFRVVATSPSPE